MGSAVVARRGAALCAAVSLGALALLCWAPSASADLEFCPPGEAAGQCAAPEGLNSLRGLALDFESGRLYVADRGNNRVDVFKEKPGGTEFLFAFGWGVDTGAAALQTCTEASGCQKGIAGEGAGQFSKPTKVAVDNDPASPSHHFVYVVDGSRVQKFDPTASPVELKGEKGGFSGTISVGVGPAGVLYVLDNNAGNQRLQRFKATSPIEAITPPPPAECTLLAGEGTAISLAVDYASGASWVVTEGSGQGIRKYDTSCTLLFTAQESGSIETNLVALDESGNPFAAQREVRDKALGSFRVITAYDAAGGNLARRFAYGRIPSDSRPEGLAPHNGTKNGGEGGIFVAVNQPGFFIKRLDFPPPPPTLPSPGPLPAPPSLEAKEPGAVKAKLLAEVNPEGKASEARFEYLTEAEYDEQGESFVGSKTKSTAPASLGASGFKLKAFEAQIGCPDPAVEAGEPDSKCLVPQTTYRWRVVATNADNPTGTGESTVEGAPFITEEAPHIGEIYATRVGADTAKLNGELKPNAVPTVGFFEYVDDAHFQASGFAEASKAPDVDAGAAPLDFGSGDELVTRQVSIFPLEPGTVYHYRLIADSPLIEPIATDAEELRTFALPLVDESCANRAARIGPGAFLPDCRAYEMVSPADKEGGDIRVLKTSLGHLAVLEQSSLSGERLAYGSARAFGDAASAPYTSQYIARRIAGLKWQTHSINPPRGRPVIAAIGQFDTEFKAFSPDLCDAWLNTLGEFPPPLPPGYLPGLSNLLRRTDGLCAAGGEAKYEALAPLTEPQGPLPQSGFVMGMQEVSADGEHALFIVFLGKLLPEASEGISQLYLSSPTGLYFPCILPDGAPVSGSCTAGSTPSGAGNPGAQIGRISDDGQRIFWSAPSPGEGKLYVRIGGAQTVAVSEEGEALSGTGKSWFWGAATDGSTAIFSTEAEPGGADLYEFDVDDEATELIAEGVRGVMGISEDAERVYFVSRKVLSGEEANANGDKAAAGEENLYLHEAGEAPGSARFIGILASADLGPAILPVPFLNHTALIAPDGAHATFVSVAPLTGYDNKGVQSGAPTAEVYRYDANADELLCVSCNPSGARPAGAASLPFWETGMHAARLLSDDGSRLYFESADVLAARDSNGKVDVYQWEEPGTGGCDEADGSFSPQAGGCVDLVSSGQSPLDSRFVEATPSGDDLFIATGSSLLPQDPGVVDIYDARVDGGLPIPVPPPPPCEGDTCAAQIGPPEEPTPASSDYVAPPEAPESKPAKPRCPKGKRRVTRNGKSHCTAKKRKHRRAGR
jgi:NHL repeat